MTKSLLRGPTFSFNKNDVISTRRIYLASCGCKNVLTHKKMVQCGRDRNVHHHPPTTKIHPQTSLYISSKCLVPSYAEFNAEHDGTKIGRPTDHRHITTCKKVHDTPHETSVTRSSKTFKSSFCEKYRSS